MATIELDRSLSERKLSNGYNYAPSIINGDKELTNKPG